MLVGGVDYPVETFIDLWVGEVCGENGDYVACGGDGVRDGFKGVVSVPFPGAEGCEGWYGTVETVQTGVANGKGVFIEGGFIKVFVMSWR